MYRILLDPESTDGGTADATEARPESQMTRVVEKPAAPDNSALLARIAAMESQIAEYRRSESERAEAAQKAKDDEAQAKGEFKRLLKERDEQLAAQREATKAAVERSKQFARDSELARALAAHNLVKGGAAQLASLWSKDFVVEESDEGGFAVRSRDLRPVAEVVAERLASEDFAHFVRASTQGGGGKPGSTAATPTPRTEARPAFTADNPGTAQDFAAAMREIGGMHQQSSSLLSFMNRRN